MGKFLSCGRKAVAAKAQDYPEIMYRKNILVLISEIEQNAMKRDPHCVTFHNIRYLMNPPVGKPIGLLIRIPPDGDEDEDPRTFKVVE
jgi:hypothetical protein